MSKIEDTILTAMASPNTELPLSYKNTPEGTKFSWSDNPEIVDYNSQTIYNLWETLVDTSFKEFEMYHHLSNAWNLASSYMFGLALYNPSSAAATITYKVEFLSKENTGGDSGACEVIPGVLKKYLEKSTTTTTLAGKGYLFLGPSAPNLPSMKVGTAQFITLRAQVKSSIAGVKARFFVAGGSRLAMSTLGQNIFSTDELPPNSTSPFCGTMPYSIRSTAMEAGQSTGKYRLFSWPEGAANQNEYLSTTEKKSGSIWNIFGGNFSVIYKITLNNAIGRRIYITPGWEFDSTWQKASVVYRFNAAPTWTAGSIILRNGCWYLTIPVPSGQTHATLEIMLPGGNNGNYWIYFD